MLKVISEILQECKVERLVMNLEMALWSVFRAMFPMANIARLCIPLESSLLEEGTIIRTSSTLHIYTIVPHKMLYGNRWPFLYFQRNILNEHCLLESCVSAGPVQELSSSVKETWINGLQSPSEWTIFGQSSICTNNDLEGCHWKLNGTTGNLHIAFYVLIPLLYKEAKHLYKCPSAHGQRWQTCSLPVADIFNLQGQKFTV